MAPVIRISDKTWERLKTYARPLEDSPDDIVNKALDALDIANGKSTRTVRSSTPPVSKGRSRAPGKKLPQREFRRPLLELLLEKGGGASVKMVRELLEPRMAPLLSDADYEPVSSGDPRWWNAVCWERNDLVKEGLLRDDSERGFWELSARGHKELERAK